MQMAHEQRKHPRHVADVVVSFRSCRSDVLVPERGEGTIENVSRGGIFLTTPSPLETGTEVELTFEVPGEERARLVSARAVVRWNRTSLEPAGMGLQFQEFASGESALRTWLDLLASKKK